MKKLFVINIFIVVLLFLQGCFDSKNNSNNILSDNNEMKSLCDDNTTFDILNKLVTDGVIDKMKNEQTSFDIAKVRASIASMKMVYGSIATTKKDPNSTQVFCRSQIKITIPSDILENIEKGYKNLVNQGTFRNANIDGFEANANNFLKNNIQYNAQPTDDGKEIYAGFDNQDQLESIVDFISMAIALEQASGISIKSTNVNLANPNESNGIMNDSNINSFLVGLLDSGCFASIDDVSTYYVKNVKKYFSFTYPTHEQLYYDNVDYCNKWIYKNYNLNSYSVKSIYNVNGIEHADVVIDIGYEVSNGTKHRSGVSKQFMTLAVEDGQIKVEQSYSAK